MTPSAPVIGADDRSYCAIRTLTETTLTADCDAFRIQARQRAWEGDQLVHDKHWDERVARDFC